MRRRMWLLVLVVLCCALVSGAASALDGRIVDYKAQCVLDSYGAATMTVTVELELPTPVTELSFPIGRGTGGQVAGLRAKRAKSDDGNLLVVKSEAGFSGQRTFTITYELPKVVTKEDEGGQLLALDLIAPGWQWPMEQAAFQVTLPAPFSEAPVYVGSYLADTVEDVLDLKIDGGVITGLYLEPVKDHDALNMTLSLPADYFDLRSAEGISPTVALILVAALALLAAAYWYRALFNRRVHAGVRPLPPDGSGAGELPLLLTGAEPNLSLQVFQWASQGYLAIHVNGRGRILLRRCMAMGSERRPQEQAVFTSLFPQESWCDGESVRYGRLAERYAAAMRQHWSRRLFSKTSGSPGLLRFLALVAAAVAGLGTASAALPQGPRRWLLLVVLAVAGLVGGFLVQRGIAAIPRRRYPMVLLGAASLVALVVLSQVYGGLPAMVLAMGLQAFAVGVTLRGGKRSPTGRDKLAQTLGFQRYLHHVTQHQLRLLLREDSQYFYRLLPLAEAMGMGEAFAAKFGKVEMEPCGYYEYPKALPRTPAGFYAEFRRALDRMNRAGRR